MKFIIGKKLSMTQIWQGDEVAAVTKVQAGPCAVVQIKTKENDGYEAAQLGYGEKKAKNIGKTMRGHLHDLGNFRHLREFRLESSSGLKRGDRIDIGTFAVGDKVQVTGTSKGKGFQGNVKRHKFSGAPKTHGNKDQLRMSGSVGATGPAHVFKGTRMPGHMGDERVTVKNLEIAGLDTDCNILYIKGAIPGSRNALVLISGPGELQVKSGAVQPDAGQLTAEKAEHKAEEKTEAAEAVNIPSEADNKEEASGGKKGGTSASAGVMPALPETRSDAGEKNNPQKSETEEVEREVVEARERVGKIRPTADGPAAEDKKS